MRKLTPVLLFSICLFFSLTIFIAGPSSAQEPEPGPPKSSNPLPTPLSSEPKPPQLAIDHTLLAKIEPQLLKKLLQPGAEPASFIVYLKATTNLSAAVSAATSGLSSQQAANPVVRRTAIVSAMQQTARDSQAGVLQALSTPAAVGGLSGQGQVTAATDIRPLWIINAVAAKGPLATILALAARPDVEIVRLDKEIKLEGWRNGKIFPLA